MPNPTQPQTGPNAPDTAGPPKGHGAVPVDGTPRHSTPNHLRPREFDSRSVLQGYPIRVHPASFGISEREDMFTWHNPTACVPNIHPPPPFSLRQWPGPRERGPQFQSIRAFPRIPKPRVVVCHPLMRANWLHYCPSPPPPDPSHHPLYTPKPHTCDQIPFCSRSPLGDRSCCLVLPRPSLLCRRLDFYVPGEPAPTRGWEALRMYNFMQGRYPGRRRYP